MTYTKFSIKPARAPQKQPRAPSAPIVYPARRETRAAPTPAVLEIDPRRTVSRESGERQTVSRDGGIRQTVSRESGISQTVSRQSGERQTVSRESGERQTVSREVGERQTVSRESGISQTVSRDGGIRQTVSREGGERQTVSRESGIRQTVSRECGERQNTARENSPRRGYPDRIAGQKHITQIEQDESACSPRADEPHAKQSVSFHRETIRIPPQPPGARDSDLSYHDRLARRIRNKRAARRKNALRTVFALFFCAALCAVFALLLKNAYDNGIYAPGFLCDVAFRLVSAGGVETAVMDKSLSAAPIPDSDGVSDPRHTPSNPPLGSAVPPETLFTDPFAGNPPAAAEERDGILSEAAAGDASPRPVSSQGDEIKSESGAAAFALTKLDLSRGSDRIYMSNETSFSPDVDALMSAALPAFLQQNVRLPDLPLVLVLHTHGTECYLPYDGDFYSADHYAARSQDTETNIVRVGKELTVLLNSYGIPTIHCEVMHDKDSFVAAYKNSLRTAEDYLEQYPSIQYVIDVHRDSIIRANNEKIKTHTVIRGEPTAQVMMVVGTSGGGAAHPNWENNLGLAFRLQDKMNREFPTLARPINLRRSRFNQHVSDGALLLEVGSCGNTLGEAITAVKMFGQCFAKLLYQK